MLALLQSVFYSGIYVMLVLILLLPLAGLLTVTAVYFLCDLIRFLLGRRYPL